MTWTSNLLKFWLRALGLTAALAAALAAGTAAAASPSIEAPEVLIERLATQLMKQVKADATLRSGNLLRLMELVDQQLMPHVNFTRMTASAVGRSWRQATPEQRQRLQQEFKTLLVRTYAGALSQLTDQALVLRPSRYRPEDTEVVIRSEIRGRGEPVPLDYRLEKTSEGWKVFDLNVLGLWLVDTYRGQFAQEITAKGIDGLIAALSARNRAPASTAATPAARP